MQWNSGDLWLIAKNGYTMRLTSLGSDSASRNSIRHRPATITHVVILLTLKLALWVNPADNDYKTFFFPIA